MTKTYPSGRTIVEEYDLRQRMTGLKENNNYFVTLAYNANDFLTQRAYGNGTTTNFVYNALNQLTQLTDNPNIANVQMTYDAVGNMLSKKDLLRPTKSEAYGYDALNRLTSFKQGEISTGVEIPNPLKQVQYAMDALGNRTTVTTNGVATQYTANNMNAYTAITGGQNMTPQYDDNGNMTCDGTHTYQYNYNNRLVSVDNGQTATYTYDALNRRIKKSVVEPVETMTNYYYCGDQAIEERNAADAVQATYIFSISVDDVLQMQRGGNTYYYHKNHLGSVVALTDGSGNLVERYEYDPYGQPAFFDANDNALSQSAVGNSILFTGRDHDAETGLYYYRARTMHPTLGRFMQLDPLMYVDGMNRYSYVGDKPIDLTDAWGLIRRNRSNSNRVKSPNNLKALNASNTGSTPSQNTNSRTNNNGNSSISSALGFFRDLGVNIMSGLATIKLPIGIGGLGLSAVLGLGGALKNGDVTGNDLKNAAQAPKNLDKRHRCYQCAIDGNYDDCIAECGGNTPEKEKCDITPNEPGVKKGKCVDLGNGNFVCGTN